LSFNIQFSDDDAMIIQMSAERSGRVMVIDANGRKELFL